MSWLDYFIRPRALPPALAARIAAWQRLPAADSAMAPRRWVVVDTETSGLDMARCNLIAIGAVAIENDVIVVAPSFEAVLRQDSTSPRANIEIHGVGAEAQAHGEEPAEALVRFLEFVGKDALIAYHVAFDAAFLRRAIKARLGLAFHRRMGRYRRCSRRLHIPISRAAAAVSMAGLRASASSRGRATTRWPMLTRLHSCSRSSRVAPRATAAGGYATCRAWPASTRQMFGTPAGSKRMMAKL
jgi:hypothetical protein